LERLAVRAGTKTLPSGGASKEDIALGGAADEIKKLGQTDFLHRAAA
jgi:hypothetical protein